MPKKFPPEFKRDVVAVARRGSRNRESRSDEPHVGDTVSLAMSHRCVVAVHAHPDDESSKGAASMAKYAALGVRTVLVTCTTGGAGEAAAAAMSADGDLVAIRARELDAAAAILGYSAAYQLAYLDSGMTGDLPGAFASIDPNRIAAQLGAIFDAERPDVVVTYDPEYATGHPDHQHAHDATVLASQEHLGHRPAKLYGIRTYSPARLAAMHAWLTQQSLPSPYEGALASVGVDATTSRIDVRGYVAIARRALRAHRSQVAPDEPWFFAVPTDALEVIHPWDDYQLLSSQVARRDVGGEYETDLFAGLR
jgi:mycothiol S-conjugate amidase